MNADTASFLPGTRGSTIGFVEATAPRSPSNVVRFVYPAGGMGPNGGFGVGGLYLNVPVGTRTVYISYHWKLSEGFTVHPAVVKTWYFRRDGDTGSLVPGFRIRGGTGTYQTGEIEYLGISQALSGPGNMPPNVVGAPTLRRGEWIHSEILAVMNSSATSNDGIFRAWHNGVLGADYNNVQYSQGGEPLSWRSVNLDPYYGGNWPPHVIPEECYLFVDHALIATSTARVTGR